MRGLTSLVILTSSILGLTTFPPTPGPLSNMQGSLWSENGRAKFAISIVTNYKNHHPWTTQVRVSLPIVSDIAPHQKVITSQIIPATSTITTDVQGNRRADYHFSQVLPGQTIKLEQQYDVAISGRSYNLSREYAENTSLTDPLHADKASLVPMVPKSDLNKEAVKQTALAVTASGKSPYYKLLQVYDFLRDFNFDTQTQSKSELQALSSREVQCEDAARLLCELAQELGFSTIERCGFMANPDRLQQNLTHAWSEVAFPQCGFVPIDPTMGRFDYGRMANFGKILHDYVILWNGNNQQGFLISESTKPGGQADKQWPVHSAINCRYLGRENGQGPKFSPRLKLGRPIDLSNGQQVELNPSQAQLFYQALNSPKEKQQELLWSLRHQHPQNPALGYALAEAYAKNQNDQLQAYFQQLPTESAALGLGLLALYQRNWDLAETWLKKSGHSLWALQARSLLYYHSGQTYKALSNLQKMEPLGSTAGAAEINLLIACDSSDWPAALWASEQACQYYPQVEFFMLSRLQAAFRCQNKDKIALYLHKWQEYDPLSGLPELAMAQLYLERAQIGQTLLWLERSLPKNLSPDDQQFALDLRENLRHNYGF